MGSEMCIRDRHRSNRLRCRRYRSALVSLPHLRYGLSIQCVKDRGGLIGCTEQVVRQAHHEWTKDTMSGRDGRTAEKTWQDQEV